MKRIIYVLFSMIANLANADDFIQDAEPAILQVYYDQKVVRDTTDRASKYVKDEMILRIGKSKSVFCSRKRLWADSLQKVDNASYHIILDAAFEKNSSNAYREVKGLTSSFIYKNIPEGKITEHEYFDMTPWGYTEEWEKPEWTVGENEKVLLGYICFEATTTYRGRKWTAWFTPEIPIQEGPWKLCGLPGLILAANDENNDYSYEATGMIQNDKLMVGLINYWNRYDRIFITRDKFLNNWYRYKHSDLAAKISVFTGGLVNPKRIKQDNLYDREETNYPHDL